MPVLHKDGKYYRARILGSHPHQGAVIYLLSIKKDNKEKRSIYSFPVLINSLSRFDRANDNILRVYQFCYEKEKDIKTYLKYQIEQIERQRYPYKDIGVLLDPFKNLIKALDDFLAFQEKLRNTA